MDITGDAPAKLRSTSFDHLHRHKPLRCAIQIEGNPITGNPFESTTLGYEIKVDFDPGKYGQPSVGLDFIMSKIGVDTKGRDNFHAFALGWEPGVRIGGQWMMENFITFEAQNPPSPKFLERSFPEHIRKIFEEERNKEKAPKLLCVAFQSNVHKSTSVDTNWPWL